MNWQHANYGVSSAYSAFSDYSQTRDSISRAPTQNNVPQSPTSSASVEDEDLIRSTTKQPDPSCHSFDGFVYGLKVIQQPNRARMCGFGDKDRRPISAPPIVQLIVLDEATKKEIDYTASALELSHYVCQVDIYSRDGSIPKNLLRSNGTQGSISMATTAEFPVTQVSQPPEIIAQRLPVTDAAHRMVHGPYTVSPYQQNGMQSGYSSAYTASPYSYPNGYTDGANGNGSFPPSYGPPRNHDAYAAYPAPNPYEDSSRHRASTSSMQSGYQTQRTTSSSSYAGPSNSAQSGYVSQGSVSGPIFSEPLQMVQANFQPGGAAPPTPPADPPAPLNTGPRVDRNLIGTLCTSAVLLKDLDNKEGIFFIWGDLSVRTEDWFSLKFSFFNVGGVLRDASFGEVAAQAKAAHTYPSDPPKEGTAKGERNLAGIRAPLIAKTAPCLATVFTQCFKVFSAKKFPGVVESTRLNAHFAKQGVKITVRSEKDGNNDGDKNANGKGNGSGNGNGKRKRTGAEDNGD